MVYYTCRGWLPIKEIRGGKEARALITHTYTIVHFILKSYFNTLPILVYYLTSFNKRKSIRKLVTYKIHLKNTILFISIFGIRWLWSNNSITVNISSHTCSANIIYLTSSFIIKLTYFLFLRWKINPNPGLTVCLTNSILLKEPMK